MDYTLINTGPIAVSGSVDKDEIHSYFPLCRIVPWASHIRCLISDGGDTWKSRMAVQKGIPIQSWVAPVRVPGKLWTDKYAPVKAADIIGHDSACKEVYTWLMGWKKGTPSGKRAILITGPPGIGKTTAAHLLVKHCGYEIIEQNASCVRSAGAVHAAFEEAMRSRVCGAPRVLIMDEVDGMSSGDRGGIAALASMLKTCTFPVICIANERGSPRMRPLNTACEEIQFKRPQARTIAKALMESVVKKEGVKISREKLEELCEKNGNDIRCVLNLLQLDYAIDGAACGSVSSKDETLRMDAWSATKALFERGDYNRKTELCWVDHSMIPLMVAEGYLYSCSKSRGDETAQLSRACAAADLLGMYDIMDARIHRSQAWGLMPAAMNCVASAASVCCGLAPFQLFPQLLGKMSKRTKHTRMIREIAESVGETVGNVVEASDLYRVRLFGGGKDADAICSELDDLRLTRDMMMEGLVETAFDEKKVIMDSKLKSEVSRKWKKTHVEKEKETVMITAESEEYDSEEEEDFV